MDISREGRRLPWFDGLMTGELPRGSRRVLVSSAWPLRLKTSGTSYSWRPRSSMTPEPRMSCPGCISFVTHAFTLIVLSSTVILNVISHTKFRGWPFASNRATGPRIGDEVHEAKEMFDVLFHSLCRRPALLSIDFQYLTKHIK